MRREQIGKQAFTLVELLVVLAIIAVIVAFLFPLSRGGSQRAARRMVCSNNLKQIGIALLNYHDEYGAFPPAYTVDANGKPLHSWRTLILPFTDGQRLYDEIDFTKPWNDPANKEAYDAEFDWTHCPSANIPGNHTTYLAVVTSSSCLQPIESHSLGDITDGATNTIAVVEVDAAHAVHWMQPTDIDEAWPESLAEQEKLSHDGGIMCLFLDGRVRFIQADTSADVMRAMITIAGGEGYEMP